MNLKNIAILIMLTILFMCCENKLHKVKWYKKGNYVCKDSTDKENKVLLTTCYNKDTSTINGPQIFYNSKGKVVKWKWYSMPLAIAEQYDPNIPVFVAYYNDDGNFEEFNGSPFLRMGLSATDGRYYVEMVSPPFVPKVVIVRDSFNNKLVKKYVVEPGETDSTCFFALDDNPIISHKCWLTYRIYDSLNNNSTLDEHRVQVELID